MNKNIPCEVIQDLLPLYIDSLVSDATAKEVECHLKDCPLCREHYDLMRAALAEERGQKEASARQELDYLKKLRHGTWKKVLLGSLSVLFLLTAVLFAKFYVIGWPNEDYFLTYLDVAPDGIYAGGMFYGSACVYNRHKIKETDSGSRLVVYSCLPSPWNRDGAFRAEIPIASIGDSIDIAGTTVKKDGFVISKMANSLYQQKNPYIGNASADGALCQTLKISDELGPFTMQLQTTTAPYGLTLHFQNSVSNSAVFEEHMKAYACILMALIENAGEISWDYTVELADGPVARTSTMTEADCTAYLDRPVKDYSASPDAVQELLNDLAEDHEVYLYHVK